jgi:hypothetical protein
MLLPSGLATSRIALGLTRGLDMYNDEEIIENCG